MDEVKLAEQIVDMKDVRKCLINLKNKTNEITVWINKIQDLRIKLIEIQREQDKLTNRTLKKFLEDTEIK